LGSFISLSLKAAKGNPAVPNLFEDERCYVLGDPELEVIGNRGKLAQWRHRQVGPPYFKIGRKVIYRGTDLNTWLAEHRIDPTQESVR
jgi:hypothetical protein